MNKLPTKIIAVVTLLSMAVSSMASERTTVAYSLRPSPNPAPLTAPLVLSRKVALSPAELAKYQLLAGQSLGLATHETAGASDTTKTVLIVVGVVVVGLGLLALNGSNTANNISFSLK